MRAYLACCVQLSSPQYRRDTYSKVSPPKGDGGDAGTKVLQHLSYKESERARLCRLQEEDRGDFTNVYEYLMGRSKDRAKRFSGVPSDRMRSNGHKLKYRKCLLNGRKKEKEPFFFYSNGDWTFKQLDLLSGCGVSICADAQSLTGCRP